MKTSVTVRKCMQREAFQCPRTWDALAVTDDPAIRYCVHCQENVHFCVSDRETIAHAWAGHCIAREIPDDSEMPAMFMGSMGHPIEYTAEEMKALAWTHREHWIDEAINTMDAHRSCPECGFPAPRWRVACRVCGFEMGRIPSEDSA